MPCEQRAALQVRTSNLQLEGPDKQAGSRVGLSKATRTRGWHMPQTTHPAAPPPTEAVQAAGPHKGKCQWSKNLSQATKQEEPWRARRKGTAVAPQEGSGYKAHNAAHFMKGSPARFRDVLLARSAPHQARASNPQLPNNCLLVSILPDRECYLGLKLI